MTSRTVRIVVVAALGALAVAGVLFALVLARGCLSMPVDTSPPAEPGPPPRPSSDAILTDLARWDAAATSARRAAAEDVARRLPDFALLRLETFSCGGQTHEVAIFKHAKTEMEFVLVPGGKLAMGVAPDVHEVALRRSFLIARTEATWGAWARVFPERDSAGHESNRPFEAKSANGWSDVVDFCGRTSLELPSEARWEWAGRAGVAGAYCFGDDKTLLPLYAWSEPNTVAHYPTAVATLRANAFGLFDIHGNVQELCADRYGRFDRVFDEEPVQDGSPMMRVVRGGHVNYSPVDFGYRSAFTTNPIGGGSRGELHTGFRPAKTVPVE